MTSLQTFVSLVLIAAGAAILHNGVLAYKVRQSKKVSKAKAALASALRCEIQDIPEPGATANSFLVLQIPALRQQQSYLDRMMQIARKQFREQPSATGLVEITFQSTKRQEFKRALRVYRVVLK
jgi:hypothetical protein